LVVVTVAVSVKGAILDQAPANAYFWLFVGLSLGSASWARGHREPDLANVKDATQ
jgi:hypothetical protein